MSDKKAKNSIAIEKNSNLTLMLTLTAMFSAVLAAASWISVPLPFTPIPINLATLAVAITGAVLGKKYGTMSVLIYILLGAIGIPVFAGFTGGLSHIAGPTGGYIIGYMSSSFICGALIELFYAGDTRRWWVITTAAILGTASCYVIGTLWFMFLTGNTLAASLTLCVIPFIPGDIFKAAAATILIPLIKNALARVTGYRPY